MAKKSGSGGVAFGVIAIVLAAIASIPKEAIIACVVVVVAVVIYRAFKTKSPSPQVTPPEQQRRESLGYREMQSTEIGLRVEVVDRSSENSGYRIPQPSRQPSDAKWIPFGDAFTVASTEMADGMIYIGSALPAVNGFTDVDPCLINPSLLVASEGDYRDRHTNYWPAYSSISPAARRAYLNWLASGRRASDADLGYVFLFFYGLERRILVDLAQVDDAKPELQIILNELEDLLQVYGKTPGSFARYGNALANVVRLLCTSGKFYQSPLPLLPHEGDVPSYVRVALGQAAQDGVAIPAQLALAWLRHSSTVSLRTPATRCAEQFDRLFSTLYEAEFGAGIKIQPNRTKLRLTYNAASSGFRRPHVISSPFSDLPDVTVLSAPIKRLLPLAEEATKQLEAFSRFAARNPDAISALEGLLLLPATLWPPRAQATVEQLRQRMGAGMVTIAFSELLEMLEATSTLSRDKTTGLARALHSINIGFEPDVLSGAKTPKPDEPVVLFSIEPERTTVRPSAEYQAAQLTIQLAAAVATSDGEFEAAELVHLGKQVQSWSHLSPNHQRRLLAHLRLLSKVPVSLTSLKSKLSTLAPTARTTIAAFMAAVAQADGVVTPQEVKILEKVYKALGVDAKQVFSDVHAIASGSDATAATNKTDLSAGFTLDKSKIAALQKDSEKVSAMLSEIFREEETPTNVAEVDPPHDGLSPQPKSILGLDENHSIFASALMARPDWTRSELTDLSLDLGLMLDGALEHLNDAAFGEFDVAFIEGEDPVTINPELLEKLKDDTSTNPS